MRLYRTADGRWAGTQAEAGKGFLQVDFPDGKRGVLAWLNANASGHQVPDLHGEPDPPAARTAPPADEPYRHMSAENILRRMDAQLAANRGAAAIADYVAAAVPEDVAIVAAAVAMRLTGALAERLPSGRTLPLEAAEAA
jgi:hypothetical protein